MSDNSTPAFRILSEQQLRAVLARAAAIDAAEGARFTPAEITAIAQEAGISAAAIQRALGELPAETDLPESVDVDASARESGSGRGWFTRIRFAGAAAVAGLLARLFAQPIDGGGGAAISAVLVLAAASIMRSRHHRRRGSFAGFQLEMLLIWAGFTLGFYLPGLHVGNEPATVLTAFWLGFAALGGAYVTAREPVEPQLQDTPEPTE